MTNGMIGRRGFLKGLSALTFAGSALLYVNKAFSSDAEIDWKRYAGVLVKVLDDGDRLFNSHYHRNLCWEYHRILEQFEYAFGTIQPESHHEKCVAFACAQLALGDPVRAIRTSDEYVRRRKGEPPRFPGHPLLSTIMRVHGHPETYGLMMYKEQWDSFFFYLTEELSSRRLAHQIYSWKFGKRGLESREFLDLLRQNFKAELSQADMQIFQKIFDRSYGSARSYSVYSSAVTETARRISIT